MMMHPRDFVLCLFYKFVCQLFTILNSRVWWCLGEREREVWRENQDSIYTSEKKSSFRIYTIDGPSAEKRRIRGPGTFDSLIVIPQTTHLICREAKIFIVHLHNPHTFFFEDSLRAAIIIFEKKKAKERFFYTWVLSVCIYGKKSVVFFCLV